MDQQKPKDPKKRVEREALEKGAEGLRSAAAKAAKLALTIYLSFLGLEACMAVIIGSITKDSSVKLPILDAQLPIVVVIPWLLLLVYFYLLLQLTWLAPKLHRFNDMLTDLRDETMREEHRARLYSSSFCLMLIGRSPQRRMQALLGLMVRMTVVLFPLLLLLWAQNRAAVLVDLTLLWIFWPRIRIPVQRGESATRAIFQWTKGIIFRSRKAYRTAQRMMGWMERIPFMMQWTGRIKNFLLMNESLLYSLLVAIAVSGWGPSPPPPKIDIDRVFQSGRSQTSQAAEDRAANRSNWEQSYQTAIATYRDVIRRAEDPTPDSTGPTANAALKVDAYFNIGAIYMILKNYDEAVKALEQCKYWSPIADDRTLTNLGISYLKQTSPRSDLAKDVLKQATVLNPNNALAQQELKKLLERRR